MTAGVPGLGLSGLFVLLCAVVMPLRSGRRLQPTSHPVRVRTIFGLAAAIGCAIWLAWVAASVAASVAVDPVSTPGGRHHYGPLGSFFGIPLIAVSLAIMLAVLFAAELTARIVDTRPTPTDPPVRTRRATTVDNNPH